MSDLRSPSARCAGADSRVGPLAGIRVVDLSSYVQGPAVTLELGDMGAEVIKIETPEGDPLRGFGRREDGFSAVFESLNRNKRSLALDFRQPGAAPVVHRLVAGADVLVVSLRQRSLERLGLDYPTLAARHPRLVHASTTGYGVSGPDADQPAFDIVAGGRSGYLVATGRAEGEPRRPLSPLGDLLAAKDTVIAIALALFARERSGRGQQVVTSLLASQIAIQRMNFSEYLSSGSFAPHEHRDGMALSTWYRTRDDRWIVISLLHPRFFPVLCRAIGREDLAADPRFGDPRKRGEGDRALRAILSEEFRRRTRDEWVRLLREAELPGGPVLDLPEVLEDEQVRALDLFVEYGDPAGGRFRSVGCAWKLSEGAAPVGRGAPRPGEHSAEILAEAGYGRGEIDALLASGAARA